jgi:hypothetical protein
MELENPAKIPTKEIPQVHPIETDPLQKRDRKTRELPRDTVVSQTLSLERLLRVGPKITPPPIAKGYEAIFLQFVKGKSICRLDSESDLGKI